MKHVDVDSALPAFAEVFRPRLAMTATCGAGWAGVLLYTQDLNDGRVYDGIRVINSFAVGA